MKHVLIAGGFNAKRQGHMGLGLWSASISRPEAR